MTQNLSRSSAGFCYHFVCLIDGRDPNISAQHEPLGGLVRSAFTGSPGRVRVSASAHQGASAFRSGITPGESRSERDSELTMTNATGSSRKGARQRTQAEEIPFNHRASTERGTEPGSCLRCASWDRDYGCTKLMRPKRGNKSITQNCDQWSDWLTDSGMEGESCQAQ